MPIDQVTWSPRIGTTGDDVYNIPGATKLDDTKDTGVQQRIRAGSSSFSSPPTLAQLNSSSHLNQIIGLTNRRITLYNQANGTTNPTQSYVAIGGKILASQLSQARSQIDLLRQLEGNYAPFSWSSNWPTDDPPFIKGRYFSEMRKALIIPVTNTTTLADSITITDTMSIKLYPYIVLDNNSGGYSYFREWYYTSSGGLQEVGYRYFTPRNGIGYYGPFAYSPYSAMYRIRRIWSSRFTAPAGKPVSLLLSCDSSAAGADVKLQINPGAANNIANYYSSGMLLHTITVPYNRSSPLEIPLGSFAVDTFVRFHCAWQEDGETLPTNGSVWHPPSSNENTGNLYFDFKVYYD